MTWTNERFENLEYYRDFIKKFDYNISDEIVLPVTTISLRPFGTKGNITALKSNLVSSMSSTGFSCIELLWLAHNLQAVHIKKDQENSVGIFRSGHEKKVPAYYIGGYHDDAGDIFD